MNNISAIVAKMKNGESLVIGKSHTSNIVINHESIAASHAKIIKENDSYYIKSIGDNIHTYLNGVRIKEAAVIEGVSHIIVGDISLLITNPTMNLREVTFKSKKNTILNQLSTDFKSGDFIGILGGSGAGKSTFIKLLAGHYFCQGDIVINNIIYDQTSLLIDPTISYLSQNELIMDGLSPRSCLRFKLEILQIAKEQHDEIITDVLQKVELLEHIDKKSSVLSGGQKKRLAIACELINNPSIMLVDEATSGLDLRTEKEIMKLFKTLASEGRIVLCITHHTTSLDNCNKVFCLLKGELVFFGKLDELMSHFKLTDIHDFFNLSKSQDIIPNNGEIKKLKAAARPSGLKPSFSFSKLVTLIKRQIYISLSDLRQLSLLFIQAPIIAFFIGLTFKEEVKDLSAKHASDTKQVLFVAVLSILWCSGTLGVREIIKDIENIKHELRLQVTIGVAIASKLIFLSTISLIQTSLFTFLLDYFVELPGSFFTQLMILSALSVTGVCIGLFISSISRTSEIAMTILPIVLISQAIFSSALAPMKDALSVASKCLASSYWGYQGIVNTMPNKLKDAAYPNLPGTDPTYILDQGQEFAGVLFALGLQFLILLVLTYWATVRRVFK